ncbi:MAG: rhomboid family intramembrane serine protease [Bryobacteraceae bacterium]|nr:rhomboid family intramembrane serine protease [Bryobacteraceae bacterium]
MIPLRDSVPSRSAPVVTIAIIIVNVLIFLQQLTLSPEELHFFFAHYGVVPARLQLSDLFTSMFLHGGFMHLIGNMWFLWIYGDNVEDVLGRGKYLLFYLACGIAGSLIQIAADPNSTIPNIGASGAIAGVMGAYLLKFPHARILTLIPLFVFFFTQELPAFIILIYWFVLQFFSGVGSLAESTTATGGIAFFAHVGGFLMGMLLIKVLPTRDAYWRRPELRW